MELIKPIISLFKGLIVALMRSVLQNVSRTKNDFSINEF